MSLKDKNLSARSEKSDVPTNNDDRNSHRILNILRSYEEELQQSIIDIDKDPNGKSSSNLSYQYNQNNQVYPHHNENELLNTNQTSPSMTNNSGSMPEENSSELEKDLINDAEIHSHLPIDELQNGFLTNLNNFMNNPNNKDVLKQYSKPIKPVKHLSDDASPMDEETDMSDIISTSLSDANSENKNTFSIISGISSKQVEDSHSNLSYLNYPLGDQQSSNLFSPSKEDEFKNRQDQISHISGSQMINNFMNKTGSLEAIPEDEEEHDANYNYADGGYGIPLGMLRDSKASNDLSSFIQNGSNMKFDEKSSQNENTPMSLVESQKHGRNNSGEFIGKKPSLMTIVEEDDANEENVEYEEEFEEENGENINNEQKDNKKEDNPIEKANKSNNKSDKYEKIAKELVKGYGKDIINNKRTITQSESQHNLSKGHVRQIQTSNSTNSIPLQNYIKSYSGFNSKIINLNPIDDNEGYEYEYSDDTNEPISLMEASDINISSHQSGLNGSRTIDDLVAEQKKIQVASSSSAISSKIASKESNENNSHKKSSKKRSNISLSELMSNQRSSFTAEDMMRLQNVSFPTSKENSPQDANKLQKPKYSEKEMIKDQKSLNKSQKNEESELDGNDILSSFIESQNSKAKSDKLTNLDEFINSDASTRGINADNIESIISNIEEKNSNEKNVSSGFDSSRFNDILNDNEEENEEREEEEEEEEEEASFEQVTYEVITDNIDNKEEEVEYSDNSLKSDKGKKIESFSEKNSQKNSADDKKEIKGNKDSDLSLGNSILSDFTEGNSQSEHNKSDKASTRSSQSNRSISNSDIKGKSADESDDFINSLTSDFIEAAAAEAEAEKEKKKENNEFESDFVDDEKESSNLNIEDPPSSLIESKSQSKTSDVQISVDFIEESESGKKSTKSDDSKSSSPKKSVESSISLSSDFADESKSDASSVATENQSISISFVEQSTHSSYSSSSTKKNKRKKKKKTNKKSIESTSEIKADSITSEFISEDKKSSSSASNSSKSNTAESFNNSSQFIDVESIKSNSKIESSNSISSKSGTVENESDFIDSLSSKSKTKSSSSSNKSSKISKSDSINVESIHSLDSNSKLSTNSNKKSESTSIDGESIHSLSSSKSSSSKRSSESNKASESDSINVESIHSLKSSSSKSSSGSQSEKNSQSNKASESDSINVESIHSLSSSSTRSKNRSSSNRASQSTSINDGESIHSLSSSASKSSSSKRSSESNRASESDSINIESIHSLKSSTSSKSSSSQSKSHSDSSRASDSIGIESIHSISSKSKSKSERSEMSKTSGFIDIESFHSPSSNESSSSSSYSSKSTSKSHSEFINTLSSDSKKRSEKSTEKTEDDVSKSKSKTSIDSSGFISSSKSESGSNVKSFFEFSEPASDATQKEGSPSTKALPKLQVIGSPKPGQTTKPKRLNVQGQSGKKGEKETKKTKKHPHHVHVEKSSEKDDEIERPIKLSESKSKSKISTVSILDEIDSETSMSHLTISANSSEKASGEFIGTIDVIEDKSIVSNISNESSKGSEKVVYSDDSLRKEKVPKIPKVLLKKSKNFKNESPRRQKKKNEEDEVEIEDDFLDYNSRSEEENGRVLKFKKLEISKAYDYPSKFNEELDSSLNSTKIGKNEEIVEEENENEEVEVDNMTESIIKKPRKKTSKRVVIDLKNNNNKNESDDKNNTKSPIRFERLSMSPMFRNDIMPSKGNMSLTNITNISNNENRSKHSHAHKHKHRHQNKTELPIGIQKVQDVDNKTGIKTPQPIHRVIKISRSPTTITSNNTNITDTSIRVSNIPSAAEMVDQNYVNTLKSAKLSLQYIKESINASRQMRYTRQSAMDPFQYTVNP